MVTNCYRVGLVTEGAEMFYVIQGASHIGLQGTILNGGSKCLRNSPTTTFVDSESPAGAHLLEDTLPYFLNSRFRRCRIGCEIHNHHVLFHLCIVLLPVNK